MRLQMVKKNSIYVPVRLATKREMGEIICGTIYCPACDTKVIDEAVLNKMPFIDDSDILRGWVCAICDSIFDLRDNVIEIGEFDSDITAIA